MDCSECDKEDAISFEWNNPISTVLEFGKFAPGSTLSSTPGCMPPWTEVELLSDISPAYFHAQSKRPS